MKVRLSHDNTGNYPELLVSHMRMTRLPRAHASMEWGHSRDGIVSSASSHSLAEPNLADLTFYFNAWLSQNIGDGQVTREVASRGSLGLILREQRRLRQETLKRPQKITSMLPATQVPKLPVDEVSQLPSERFSTYKWFYSITAKLTRQINSHLKHIQDVNAIPLLKCTQNLEGKQRSGEYFLNSLYLLGQRSPPTNHLIIRSFYKLVVWEKYIYRIML